MNPSGNYNIAFLKLSQSWLVLFFAFTIPIYPSVSIKVLVISLILTLLRKRFALSFSRFSRNAWDILLYFLILGLGIFYSVNWKGGISVLETNFSLLALSIIFSQSNFNANEIRNLILAFMSGLIVACCICIGNAIMEYGSGRNFDVFFYYQLTDVINSHPTYLAYYLIASITYCIFLIYNEVNRINRIIPIVIFFFLMLMLTGGRTAYISLLLIFAFFILKYIMDESSNGKAVAFCLVIVLLFSLFGLNYVKYFDNGLIATNDYWERSVLWGSAIKANPNPILGVGTGDYKTALNAYYQSHGMAEFARDSFNAHNQFIQIYFSNGLLGLITLVILVSRPLYLSVINQNTLGILLIFPFIIYGVSEVFLGRYQGVVFFALLHQIIIQQHYSNKPSVALNAS